MKLGSENSSRYKIIALFVVQNFMFIASYFLRNYFIPENKTNVINSFANLLNSPTYVMIGLYLLQIPQAQIADIKLL